MKTWIAMLTWLILASPAAAQGTGPVKMILLHGQGVAVTDYSNMARCEAARAAIRRAIAENNANLPPPQALPGGGTITTLPTNQPKTLCVPG